MTEDYAIIERFLQGADGIEKVWTIAGCLLIIDVLEIEFKALDERLKSWKTFICTDYGDRWRNGEHLRVEFVDPGVAALELSETGTRDMEACLKRKILCGLIVNEAEEA